jgi:hypothetical protein
MMGDQYLIPGRDTVDLNVVVEFKENDSNLNKQRGMFSSNLDRRS